MDWLTGRLPLRGVRVIDWSVYWAGPYLSMMLHDLGAEVIKVESPSSWDPMRTIIDVNRGVRGTQRPMTPQERCNINQHFNEWNRGKLGLGIELREERGRHVLLDLIAHSDIFVENHRPHVKEKLGITYEDLKKVNPGLIYLSLSGYGQTQPDRDAMALGSPVEVASGLFAMNGYLDDPTPAKTGFSYGDPVGALTAAGAVLMAVRKRRRTGEGSCWDIALRDALSFGIGAAFTDWSMNSAVRPHRGNRHPVYAPQGVYRAFGEDEWVAISVRGDDEWERLAGAIGLPDRPEFATADRRRERHDEIDGLLETWTRGRIAREVEVQLQAEGVPAAAVLNYRQLRRDPQLNARGMFREITHPAFGREVRSASIWERGQLAPPIDLPAPMFGQHNHEILTRVLDMGPDKIEELERTGVLGDEILAAAD
ncbi:MAG TPA: CoA transferase [Dehalococcoidia bacterium]|nr:CoA transferase [Dehalococcoidia bacterium]